MNKSIALLVGINYAGTDNELRGCINDVIAVKNFLTTKGFSDIVSLTDDNPEYMPTKDNILRHLAMGISKLEEGDTMYFHYSGHGSQTSDRNNEELDGMDETLIPCDYSTKGTILDDNLRDLIYRVPKGANFIGVVDACHSETSFDLKYIYDPVTKIMAGRRNLKKAIVGNRLIKTEELLSKTKMDETEGNIFILSGCKDNQTSADAYINDKFSGALTKGLLETLNTYPNCGINMLPVKIRDYIVNNKLGDQIPRLSFGRADFKLEKSFL